MLLCLYHSQSSIVIYYFEWGREWDSTLEQIVEGVDEADRPKLLEKVLDMLQQAERGLPAKKEKYTRRDSNPQPSVPKTDALSSWATDADYLTISRAPRVSMTRKPMSRVL